MSDQEGAIASAPAKVNLYFGVGATLSDGFHDVTSVYQELDLREQVSVHFSKLTQIRVEGNIDQRQLALVPKSDSNLVSKAARLIANFADAGETNFEFEIYKRVPVAGGMAGGSADAAAALIACDHLLQTNLSRERLLRESVELGSDVPFAILGGTAIGRGRGEQLESLELGGSLHFVMILNQAGLSTPAVYAELDRQREEAGLDPRQMQTPPVPEPLIEALRAGDARAIAANIHNDLQSAALRLLPELELTISAAERYGAIRAFVSGSGPTVAAIVDTADDATALAVALQHANFNAFPVQSDSRGTVLEPNER